MAEDKKGFILYADLLSVVAKLIEKDRENKTNYAGELFYHILLYVNDKDPIPIDFIIEMAFEPIKLQLKRDLKKYEVKKQQQSDAGKASAEARRLTKLTSEHIPSTDSTTVEIPSTDSSDSVTDIVTDKAKEIEKRKQKFASTLIPFVEIYGKEMIRDFYEYWIEKSKSGLKFRMESENHWDVERRLKTWANKSKEKFGAPKDTPTTYTPPRSKPA